MDTSFAQILLTIAVIASVFVIGFLWWDNTQNNNRVVMPAYQVQNATPQLTPTPSLSTSDSVNTITSDFNKTDQVKYEGQIELGQTQLGVDASVL